MLSSHLILHQDYEARRRDRSAASASLHHRKNSLETLHSIQLWRLPEMLPVMLDNPLTPNLLLHDTS